MAFESKKTDPLVAYTPYGFSRPAASIAKLGFNGCWRGPVDDYYALGNGRRLLNTLIGRFVSPDRLSPFSRGGLNTYAYCQGDPVNFSDPSGQFSVRKAFGFTKKTGLTKAFREAGLPMDKQFIYKKYARNANANSQPAYASLKPGNLNAIDIKVIKKANGKITIQPLQLPQEQTSLQIAFASTPTLDFGFYVPRGFRATPYRPEDSLIAVITIRSTQIDMPPSYESTIINTPPNHASSLDDAEPPSYESVVKN